MNQITADTEPTRQQHTLQPQPADTSSADSRPRRNIPQITAAEHRQARKRRNDRAYRERLKGKQKQMMSTLKTVEAENEQLKSEKESLKEENVLVKQSFETQSKELDELRNNFGDLNQKFNKKLERKRELKSRLTALEAENGRSLRDIESLKEHNGRSETQSNELEQLRSKVENLEKEVAWMKTCGNRESLGGSSTIFIGGFGQYWLNWETEGAIQSSQAMMLPSYPAFPSGASSTPVIRPPSPQSLRTFERPGEKDGNTILGKKKSDNMVRRTTSGGSLREQPQYDEVEEEHARRRMLSKEESVRRCRKRKQAYYDLERQVEMSEVSKLGMQSFERRPSDASDATVPEQENPKHGYQRVATSHDRTSVQEKLVVQETVIRITGLNLALRIMPRESTVASDTSGDAAVPVQENTEQQVYQPAANNPISFHNLRN